MSGILGGLLASLKSAIAKVYFFISKAGTFASNKVYLKTVYDSNNDYYTFYTNRDIVKRSGSTNQIIWAKNYNLAIPYDSLKVSMINDVIYFYSFVSGLRLIVQLDLNGNITSKKNANYSYVGGVFSQNLNCIDFTLTEVPIGKGTRNEWYPIVNSYPSGAAVAKSIPTTVDFVGYYPKVKTNPSNKIFMYGTSDNGYGTAKEIGSVYSYTPGDSTAQKWYVNFYAYIVMNLAPANSGNYYLFFQGLQGIVYNRLIKVTNGAQTTYGINGVTTMQSMLVDSSEQNLYLVTNLEVPASRSFKVVKVSLSGTWSVVWEKTITVGTSGAFLLYQDFYEDKATLTFDNNGDLVFGVSSNTSAPTYAGLEFIKLKSDGSTQGTFTAGTDTVTISNTSTISLTTSVATVGTLSTVSLVNTPNALTLSDSGATVTGTDVTATYNSTEVRVDL